MKTIKVIPLREVNGIKFGCDRKTARKGFGSKYKEIKKNIFSKNTMDAYESYHVYFSQEGLFEAIEIFGDVDVVVNGKHVFPGKVNNLKETFPKIQKEDDGLVDNMNSVGVTLSQDDEDIIDAILFGCEGYYL